MADWINRLLSKEPKSAAVAKERLQFVLIHDRNDLSAATLDALKDDIIAAISHHVDIDPQSVRIEVTKDGYEQRLIADIPLRSRRRPH
jgi:cell division topological specificity factor